MKINLINFIRKVKCEIYIWVEEWKYISCEKDATSAKITDVEKNILVKWMVDKGRALNKYGKCEYE